MAFPSPPPQTTADHRKPPQIEAFTYREIATALIKARQLHEGIWAVDIHAGIQGCTMTVGTDLVPALMVPLLKIGLCRCDKESDISVDAATVNPAVLIGRA